MTEAALSLDELVRDFADALLAVDRRGDRHKSFRPGIGPFGEAQGVALALTELRRIDARYRAAAVKRAPDLLIPGHWAVEVKIIRPFGDNGLPAEHWSENVLHPYSGNTSSLGDCEKLLASSLPERRAVLVYGFEHAPVQTDLSTAMRCFEVIAGQVLGFHLGAAVEARREGLRHPVHQVLRVFGYEVLRRSP